jgi:ABC-type Na+ efflux pump permease subunit
MKMVSLVLYKEFLELKANKMRIWCLAISSIGFGLSLPVVYYLQLAGILPTGMMGIGPQGADLARMIGQMLEHFVPVMLPFFLSVTVLQYAISSIAQEIESRTLERLLSLPLSWRTLFFSKFIFYLSICLACAYTMVLAYFSLSSVIVEAFQPVALGIYLLVVVPAVVFYTMSAGLFISARTRTVRSSNLYGGLLTSGLFMKV